MELYELAIKYIDLAESTYEENKLDRENLLAYTYSIKANILTKLDLHEESLKYSWKALKIKSNPPYLNKLTKHYLNIDPNCDSSYYYAN